MDFKEIIQSDIKNVFLNPFEFGERHTIAGKEIICVVDDDLTSDEVKVQIRSSRETAAPGLYSATIAVFISAKDLGKLKKGSTVDFDGRWYTVDSVSEQDGLYKVILQQNRGR